MAGIGIEPSLVDVLVKDIRDEQALPLLSLALNRLWLRYEDKKDGFTERYYQELKGMEGLIDREADSTLAGTGLQEASVLDAFLNLIRLAREDVPVRHPVEWDVLKPEAQKSLKPFVDAHLLVSYSVENQDNSSMNEVKQIIIVDLVHETLLRGWGRLHKWALTENRDFLLWREELRYKVNRWSQAKKHNKPLALLEGTELKEAKKWLHSKRLALTIQEAAYIEDGIKANKIPWGKLAVTATVLAIIAGGGWGFTRTNIYQLGVIESAFPELMRTSIASHESSLGSERFIQLVFTQLMELGRFDLAAIAADKIDDAGSKATAITIICKMLVEDGQTQQALTNVDKIHYAENKAAALQSIATALWATGQTQQAIKVLIQSLDFVDEIKDPETKATTLHDIAQALAANGQAQKALAVVAGNNNWSDSDKDITFEDIAKALAAAGQVKQALLVADEIKDPERKATTLQDIAKALTETGQAQKALPVAYEIKDPKTQATTLTDIAKALTATGQIKQAVQALTLAQTIAVNNNWTNTFYKDDTFEDIAKALAATGEVEQALLVANKFLEPETTPNTLQGIAKALVETGKIQYAHAVADEIKDPETKASTLQDIAKALTATGQAQKALPVADEIKDPETKATTLHDIAQTLAATDQIQQAVQALTLAQTVTDEVNDPKTKATVLTDIAKALTTTGQIQQAVQALTLAQTVADNINSAKDKATALREIAAALTVAGQIQQALDVIEKLNIADTEENRSEMLWKFGSDEKQLDMIGAGKVNFRESKADSLGSVIKLLVVAGHIPQAFAIVEKLDDAEMKQSTFQSIATALAGIGEAQHALDVADKINEPWKKATTLENIAKTLSETSQAQQLLNIMDKIGDAEKKAATFRGIAKALEAATQPLHISDDNVERKNAAILENVARVLAAADQTQQVLDNIDHAENKIAILRSFAIALAAVGQTQKSLVIVGKVNFESTKEDILNEMAITLAHTGMIDSAKLVLDEAVRVTNSIANEKTSSKAYRDIAMIYAQLGQYYSARVTAETAKFSDDTLKGYMAIMKYYAIEKNSALAEKLAKHEEEEF
jgi:tetratricopeptide (TPR) repeat protein